MFDVTGRPRHRNRARHRNWPRRQPGPRPEIRPRGRSGSIRRPVRPPGRAHVAPGRAHVAPGRAHVAPGRAGAVRGHNRAALYHAHEQQPPRLLGHGVLAAKLATHAPARYRSPPPDRQERRERHRRGRRRAPHGHRERDHQRRRIEEMPDRPAEHQEDHQKECRHPARRPGVTDHGQPLIACVPSRVGRAPLPVLFLDPSASAKSQDPVSTRRGRSVIKASSPAKSASAADR